MSAISLVSHRLAFTGTRRLSVSSPYYYHFLITTGRSAICICCTPRVGKTSRERLHQLFTTRSDILGTYALDEINVSVSAMVHGCRQHSASFRLGWNVPTGVWHSEIMAVSPLVRLPTYPTSTKALPFFGAYLLGAHPCLASEPAMPYVPTTRTVSLYFSVLFSPDVSAFRACLGLFRVLRSNYVRVVGRLKHGTTLC
jgi:hypothetical protein